MPNNQQSDPSIGDTLNVRRGRLDSVTIYEVKESELEILERGSPGSIYLNFAIFTLSVGFSSLTTLLTIEVQDVKKFSVFTICAVVGILMGLILLVLWRRFRTDTKTVCNTIKNRVPLQSEDAPSSEQSG